MLPGAGRRFRASEMMWVAELDAPAGPGPQWWRCALLRPDGVRRTANVTMPSPALESLEFHDGLGVFRLRGRHSLVEAVDRVSHAIARCRAQGAPMLLVDALGMVDLPIPTLVDRFLMVEDWAQAASGTVIVAMVVAPEYIHPRKFGVTVARQFGLICDVFASEDAATAWLLETAGDTAASSD
jgi:hypothetical protein